MDKLKFIEIYKDFNIYENTDGSFVIYSDYQDEKIEVTEKTLEDMKILIDYL